MVLEQQRLYGVIDSARRCISAHSSGTEAQLIAQNMGPGYHVDLVGVTLLRNAHGVQPGQIWRARAKRENQTPKRIVRVEGDYAFLKAGSGPTTRVRLDRFDSDYIKIAESPS